MLADHFFWYNNICYCILWLSGYCKSASHAIYSMGKGICRSVTAAGDIDPTLEKPEWKPYFTPNTTQTTTKRKKIVLSQRVIYKYAKTKKLVIDNGEFCYLY